MIDPITLSAAVTGATAAYNAVKKAIMFGKEIDELSGELGKWMTSVSDIDNISKSAANPSKIEKLFNGSIEQVAMESFAAKKRIDKQRGELKNFLTAHYGMTAWDDLLRTEGRIRKARQKAIYEKEQYKQQVTEYAIIGVATLVGLGAVAWMAWIISMSMGQ